MPEDVGHDTRLPEESSALNGNGAHFDFAAHPEPVRNGASAKAPAGSSFWHNPLKDEQDLHWHHPPIPEQEAASPKVEGLLEELGGLLGNMRQRAWFLRWNYHTRAAAAAELRQVDQESRQQIEEQVQRAEREVPLIDAEILRLREAQPGIETDLAAAQQQFAEAAAEAGLVGEPGAAISPQGVENALRLAQPGLREMAGEHGITPTTTAVKTTRDSVIQVLAPLVCGFMLAVCLGTLVGILSLNDLQRGDRLAPLVLSALLGFVIVSLMGEIVSGGVQSLSRCLDIRQKADTDPNLVPQFRKGAVVAGFLIVVALFLCTAEITAEGIGIRMLHEQFEQSNLDNFTASAGVVRPGAVPQPVENKDLPLGVYLLIGALVSGPYLAYKAAKAWGEGETLLRESWLLHRQRAWADSHRSSPAVRLAFQHAHRVEHLANRQREIAERITILGGKRDALQRADIDPATQARRQNARAAAVGEAARLQEMVAAIVESCEPLPENGIPASAVASTPTTAYARH